MPYLISMVGLAKKNGSQIILDITDIVQRSHKSNTISTRDWQTFGNRSSLRQAYAWTQLLLALWESYTMIMEHLLGLDYGFFTTVLGSQL